MQELWVYTLVMNNIFFLGVVVVIAVAGFFVFNKFIYDQKQATVTIQEPYQATLTGEYVCLPHKDQSGPTTLECTYGLKTPNDEYFALDFGGGVAQSDFVVGERVELSGTITPIERLSTDYYQKYDVQGIFTVLNPRELELAIKNQLIAKHGSSVEALDISVSKVEGAYATGGAGKEGLGGGMWFAAQVDGLWKLVWDGNGIISCADLESYPDFPTTMIPECFDPIGGEMVER